MAASRVFQSIQQPDDKTVTFTLTPTRVTYANTLRRAIQTEVLTLGFRADMSENGSTADVRILKNTTPMSNEMLADRIGLLPIAMPDDMEGGWDKNKVLFRLHVRNESETVRLVKASDFVCLEKRPTEDERVQVPNTEYFHPDPVTGDTCIIAVLKPKMGDTVDEIHLEAFASLGKGREHTRFNPTCVCAFGNTLDTNEERIQSFWVRWLEEHKKVKIADLERDPERKAVLEREFRSLAIYRCFLVDEEGEPYSFDFRIESIGTMAVSSILSSAVLAIATLADKYANIDQGDLPKNLEIRPADARLTGFDFWFTGEDHTLGNLLQTWLDDNKVGRGPEEGGVTFAGTKVPHPLRDEMVLRIGVQDGKEASARLAVAEAAKGVAEMFRDWFAEWSGKQAGPKKVWEAHAEAKERAVAAKAASAGPGGMKSRRTVAPAAAAGQAKKKAL